jgi:hypothetical protein
MPQRRIALFFTGCKHAGENFAQIEIAVFGRQARRLAILARIRAAGEQGTDAPVNQKCTAAATALLQRFAQQPGRSAPFENLRQPKG